MVAQHPVKRYPGQASVCLPPYAMGAAPLGNLYRPVDDQLAAGAVRAALESGLNYIDTAPHYGFGLSESRLGRFLAQGDEVMVSTKVGRLLEPIEPDERATVRFGFADTPDLKPVFDYSYDGIMRSFEASCRRLRRSYIDLLFAHDLGAFTHGENDERLWREFCEGGMRAMAELKAAGCVGALGLGVNETEVCERALQQLDMDVFLLAGRYTLLEQTPLSGLLIQCERRGVPVIAASPFNSGILASDLTTGPGYYNYAPAPGAIVRKARAIKVICDQFNVAIQAAALQFPAAHPQVVSVLVGLACPREVESARRWINTQIPCEFWQVLRERGLIDPRAPVPTGQAAEG